MKNKKIMTAVALISAAMFGSTTAIAQQGAFDAAALQYPTAPLTCTSCHASPFAGNALIDDWKAAGGTLSTGPTNWPQFDGGDADGDGVTNGAELLAGTKAYPNAPAPAPAAGGGGGCVTESIATPLTMALAMLTLGFFVRRKKD